MADYNSPGSTTVVNKIDYDSFGNVVSETNAAVDHIFGFTGRERDEESDLYYYRARYYDPRLAQFISEDPIGFEAGDANTRRYVGNDPVNRVDPSGLEENEPAVQSYADLRIGPNGTAEWVNVVPPSPETLQMYAGTIAFCEHCTAHGIDQYYWTVSEQIYRPLDGSRPTVYVDAVPSEALVELWRRVRQSAPRVEAGVEIPVASQPRRPAYTPIGGAAAGGSLGLMEVGRHLSNWTIGWVADLSYQNEWLDRQWNRTNLTEQQIALDKAVSRKAAVAYTYALGGVGANKLAAAGGKVVSAGGTMMLRTHTGVKTVKLMQRSWAISATLRVSQVGTAGATGYISYEYSRAAYYAYQAGDYESASSFAEQAVLNGIATGALAKPVVQSMIHRARAATAAVRNAVAPRGAVTMAEGSPAWAGKLVRQYANKVKGVDGFTDVFIHGTRDGKAFSVIHNGKEVILNQRQIAKWLKNQGVSGNIRLISC